MENTIRLPFATVKAPDEMVEVVVNGCGCSERTIMSAQAEEDLEISTTSFGWAWGSFVWSFRKFVLFLWPSCVSEMLKWAGSRPWPCTLAPVAQDLLHARRDAVRDEKLGLQSQRKIPVEAQIEAAPATSTHAPSLSARLCSADLPVFDFLNPVFLPSSTTPSTVRPTPRRSAYDICTGSQ